MVYLLFGANICPYGCLGVKICVQVEPFVKSKFWSKSKFCSKIEIFAEIKVLVNIEILVKIENFAEIEVFVKIKILVQNRKFRGKFSKPMVKDFGLKVWTYLDGITAVIKFGQKWIKNKKTFAFLWL